MAYTAEQIRSAEAPHLANGEPLMARAAAGLAGRIASRAPRSVLLRVGSGNNGADALWAGATLAGSGVAVAIVCTTDHPNPEALDAALNAGAQQRPLGLAVKLFESVDVVVDGILGIGATTSPALRGEARALVSCLLATHALPVVIAVDIPSGVNPDTGEVPDATVLRATETVTFGGHKAGLWIEPAASYAGTVTLVEVGIEDDLAALRPAATR